MRKTSYAAAIAEALRTSLTEDPRVSLVGSYVLGLGPKRVLMDPIRADFADRVYDPPISEAAVVALGAGAAMAGARPFVDIGTGSFAYVGWSPLVNEAAVACHMSGGTVRVPVVYHYLHGLRGGGAAQHSHSPQAMLWNAAGLEIVMPSSPYDVKGLIRSAIKSDNPTVFVNHARLMDIEGEVPEEDYSVPFGLADIKRPGRDVTVIATSYVVHAALAAAETLAGEGIDGRSARSAHAGAARPGHDPGLGRPHRTAGGGRRDQPELRHRLRPVGHRGRAWLQVAAGADRARGAVGYPDPVQPAARTGHHAHRRAHLRGRAQNRGLELSAMKAVRLFEFGGPEKLVYGDYPDPDVGPGDVLVKVIATSVSRWDIKYRTGEVHHFYGKATGHHGGIHGRPAFPMPMQLGRDVAGDVVAVGAAVDGFKPGDRVVGIVHPENPALGPRHSRPRQSVDRRRTARATPCSAAMRNTCHGRRTIGSRSARRSTTTRPPPPCGPAPPRITSWPRA